MSLHVRTHLLLRVGADGLARADSTQAVARPGGGDHQAHDDPASFPPVRTMCTLNLEIAHVDDVATTFLPTFPPSNSWSSARSCRSRRCCRTSPPASGPTRSAAGDRW